SIKGQDTARIGGIRDLLPQIRAAPTDKIRMRRILMPSRRRFLKQSAAAVSSVMAANLRIARSAHVAGSDLLRVGLIGCGGRGTGAPVPRPRGLPRSQLRAP